MTDKGLSLQTPLQIILWFIRQIFCSYYLCGTNGLKL